MTRQERETHAEEQYAAKIAAHGRSWHKFPGGVPAYSAKFPGYLIYLLCQSTTPSIPLALDKAFPNCDQTDIGYLIDVSKEISQYKLGYLAPDTPVWGPPIYPQVKISGLRKVLIGGERFTTNARRAEQWIRDKQAALAAESTPPRQPDAATAPRLWEWKGSATDVAELGYALLRAGVVEAPNNAENFIKALGEFLGTDVKAPAKLRENMKGRVKRRGPLKSGETRTQLLPMLKDALENDLSK